MGPALERMLRVVPFHRLTGWSAIQRMADPQYSAIHSAREAGADFVSLEHRYATPEVICTARSLGMDVRVWTVNDPRDIRQALANKAVESVVTDRADLALALRAAITPSRWRGDDAFPEATPRGEMRTWRW